MRIASLNIIILSLIKGSNNNTLAVLHLSKINSARNTNTSYGRIDGCTYLRST